MLLVETGFVELCFLHWLANLVMTKFEYCSFVYNIIIFSKKRASVNISCFGKFLLTGHPLSLRQ